MDEDRPLDNANPVIYDVRDTASSRARRDGSALDDSVRDPIDALEVFDLIRNINDPEHPLTLEQLNVAQEGHIVVDDERSYVRVGFTPTIPHCSMASLIGLCIRVRLLRTLPQRFKVDVLVNEGTHQQETALNKQLQDKERIAAAMENVNLALTVEKCLERCNTTT